IFSAVKLMSTCLICRCEDSDLTTTCFHSYHKECLDLWLKENNSCPYCRSTRPLDEPNIFRYIHTNDFPKFTEFTENLDPELKENGMFPIHLCVELGRLEMLDLLLKLNRSMIDL